MSFKSRIVTCFLSIGVILFFAQQLVAQTISKPFYNFKSYTTEDGLLSNSVHCVYKDSKGFLWIGTDRGIQRFNGSSFLNFRHINVDSNSISNNDISQIAEDKEHNIWIGSRDGITKFNYSNGRLTNYRYGYKNRQFIKLNQVLCFFEDSKARQWIGTVSTGLYLFDKSKQQFINILPASNLSNKQDPFNFINHINETAKGEIIFSVKDGFVIIDKNGQQQYMNVPVPEDKKTVYMPCGLLPLLKEYPDEVWISSQFNGVFKYHRSSKKWEHVLKHSSIFITDFVDWEKDVWLGCHFSTYLFNHRTGKLTRVFNTDKSVTIGRVYRDDAGNVWLSSQKGLFLFNPSAQLFSSTLKIPKWYFGRILNYDSSKHTLYSMSPYHFDGIRTYNTSTQAIHTDSLPGAVKFKKVINNFIADDNNLYIARWGGMCRYNLTTRKLDSIVYKNGTFNSQREVYFDVCKSADNVYFAGGGGSGSGGPYQYNNQTQVITDLALLPAKRAAQQNHSNCLYFSNHTLYTGMSVGDSIYCYNETTGIKFSFPVPKNYLNGNAEGITSMCVDKQQNLWCGTASNGIYVYNIPSQKWVRHIDQQGDNFFSSAGQLLCDEDGNVWCNGTGGLYVFNPQNFLFKNYTISDGLATEDNGGCLAYLPNHRLAYNNIFPDDTASFGIITTRPANHAKDMIPISISNLKVLGIPFLTDKLLDNVKHLILPPNQNAFSLNYAGVSLTDGKSLMYSYQLQGVEKQWQNVGNEQSLSYVNLAPGTYTLHIAFTSIDKKIVGKERLLIITLLPAWYQTWWFQLLVMLMAAGLLMAAIRYYLRHQLKKQQAILEQERALTEERSRIAADMHDDVGAGLSRIRYITASMKDKMDKSDADIDKIVSLSDESVEKMNEIIWALNQGNQQLDELIYYTRSQCSEMVSNAGLAFTFDLPENIPAITLNWKDCRNIYLLVKEAVNNSIKHAGASTIRIECFIAKNLQFTVTDNGKGFDPKLIKIDGNGLLNYKKRIQVLNGNYQLVTSPGNGTKLLFTIPFNSI